MPNLAKYVLQFCIAYLGCSALVFAVTTIFDFEAPSSMGIVSLLASTTYPMQTFVKTEQRVPTKSERVQFSVFATLASLALSAALFLGLMAFYQLNFLDMLTAFGVTDVPTTVWLLIAVFILCLSWAVIYLFSGVTAKMAMKQALKTK